MGPNKNSLDNARPIFRSEGLGDKPSITFVADDNIPKPPVQVVAAPVPAPVQAPVAPSAPEPVAPVAPEVEPDPAPGVEVVTKPETDSGVHLSGLFPSANLRRHSLRKTQTAKERLAEIAADSDPNKATIQNNDDTQNVENLENAQGLSAAQNTTLDSSTRPELALINGDDIAIKREKKHIDKKIFMIVGGGLVFVAVAIVSAILISRTMNSASSNTSKTIASAFSEYSDVLLKKKDGATDDSDLYIFSIVSSDYLNFDENNDAQKAYVSDLDNKYTAFKDVVNSSSKSTDELKQKLTEVENLNKIISDYVDSNSAIATLKSDYDAGNLTEESFTQHFATSITDDSINTIINLESEYYEAVLTEYATYKDAGCLDAEGEFDEVCMAEYNNGNNKELYDMHNLKISIYSTIYSDNYATILGNYAKSVQNDINNMVNGA